MSDSETEQRVDKATEEVLSLLSDFPTDRFLLRVEAQLCFRDDGDYAVYLELLFTVKALYLRAQSSLQSAVLQVSMPLVLLLLCC